MNTKILVVVSVVLFLLTAVSVRAVKQFMAEDTCLDRGGRVTQSGGCEYASGHSGLG